MERRVSACERLIIDRVYLPYVDEKKASSRSLRGYSRKRHVGTLDAAVCLVMRGGAACPESAREGLTWSCQCASSSGPRARSSASGSEWTYASEMR